MNIRGDISDVCTYMYTKVEGKKHGAWNFYEDDKIKIALDTYYPNMDAYLKQGGQMTQVFWAGGSGDVHIFRQGAWVDYLASLGNKAREIKAAREQERDEKENRKRAARYAPIDDKAIFSAATE